MEWVATMSDAISHQEFANQANEGGASRNFQTFKKPPLPSIMVSIPGAEEISNPPLTADQARRYAKEHEVQATGSDYQGAWKEGNKIFQDVSRRHETLDTARKAGVRDKQIAGYDYGGADIRRPEGGNVYFGRKVPGVESNPEFKENTYQTSQAERMSPKPRAQEFAEQAHISRGATNNGKPISINEVYATIAKNRRNRGV